MTAPRPSRWLDNVELHLTVVGLAVIFAVPALLDVGSQPVELAVTAILVGVVHGLAFWTVRRRQRRVRRELLREVREMLSHRIDDNLARVLANVQPPDRALTAQDRQRLTEVATAARDIAATIDQVSLEALSLWKGAQRP